MGNLFILFNKKTPPLMKIVLDINLKIAEGNEDAL